MSALLNYLPYMFGCQPQWIDETSITPPSVTDDDTEEPPQNEVNPEPPVVQTTYPSNALTEHSFEISAIGSYDPEGGLLSFIWGCSNGYSARSPSITILESVEQNLSCDVTVTSESTGLSSQSSVDVAIYAPSEQAKWTVMVYIAGDNNLEEAGIIDINEMEMIGSSEDVNILVEMDRSPRYHSGHDNWSGARRYYITEGQTDKIESILLSDLGTVDSGSADTFLDFFTWGTQNFPAERIALIFWNHGWSWSLQNTTNPTKGIMDDESTGSSLSVANGDLSQLLEDFTTETNQSIDLLGMDACTMMSWEIATVAAPWAETLVASQDYVSWNGWNYTDTLRDLQENPSMDSLELGESIGYRFWQTGDINISVLDLTLLPTFNESLDSFADALINSEDDYNFYAAARQSYSYDGRDGVDHDLLGLINNLIDNVEDTTVLQARQDVLGVFETMIYSNYVQEYLDGSNGLSIYSPPDRSYDLDASYMSASWSTNHKWDNLLSEVYDQ